MNVKNGIECHPITYITSIKSRSFSFTASALEIIGKATHKAHRLKTARTDANADCYGLAVAVTGHIIAEYKVPEGQFPQNGALQYTRRAQLSPRLLNLTALVLIHV